jgi:hypothetical protein
MATSQLALSSGLNNIANALFSDTLTMSLYTLQFPPQKFANWLLTSSKCQDTDVAYPAGTSAAAVFLGVQAATMHLPSLLMTGFIPS